MSVCVCTCICKIGALSDSIPPIERVSYNEQLSEYSLIGYRFLLTQYNIVLLHNTSFLYNNKEGGVKYIFENLI